MIPAIITSRLGICVLSLLAGVSMGWTVNNWRHDAMAMTALKAAIEERNTAQLHAREKEEEAEQLQTRIREISRDNTRKALSHAKDPDRQCPVPASVLLEHNAAAMGY